MFNWMRDPIEEKMISPEDYTFEGDGHFLAIEEAFEELTSINEDIAEMNARGVNVFAEAYHANGEQAAHEAATAFANGPVMEGFFGDMKERLVNMLKKLWAKLKAFFHRAMQYFDALFKNAKQFAEKYEDELKDKDLDKFKFKMHTYTLDAVKIDKAWKDVQNDVRKAAYNADVAITKEAYGWADNRNEWVTLLEEILYLDNQHGIYSKTYKRGFAKREMDEDVARQRGYVTSSEYKREKGTINNLDPVSDIDKSAIETRREKDRSAREYETGMKSTRDERVAKNRERSQMLRDKYANSVPEPITQKTKDPTKEEKVESITNNQRKQVREAIMKSICGGSANTTEKFRKELARKLRNGKSEPREIEPDIDKIIDISKDSDDELGKIKEIESDMNESFQNMIDKVNDSGSGKEGDDKIRIKNEVAIFTEGKNIFVTMYDVYKSAVQERNSAYKSCMSAALHYKAPK